MFKRAGLCSVLLLSSSPSNEIILKDSLFIPIRPSVISSPSPSLLNRQNRHTRTHIHIPTSLCRSPIDPQETKTMSLTRTPAKKMRRPALHVQLDAPSPPPPPVNPVASSFAVPSVRTPWLPSTNCLSDVYVSFIKHFVFSISYISRSSPDHWPTFYSATQETPPASPNTTTLQIHPCQRGHRDPSEVSPKHRVEPVDPTP